jgi:hypothetical protein
MWGIALVKAPREIALVNSCLELLRLRGICCFRLNAGAVVPAGVGRRRRVRLAPAGAPDLVAILGAHGDHPGGQFLGVEIKLPGRRPTAAQRAFGDRIVAAGGLYLVISDVGDLARALNLEGVP